MTIGKSVPALRSPAERQARSGLAWDDALDSIAVDHQGEGVGLLVPARLLLARIGIVADWRSRHGMENIVVEAHRMYALQVTSPQVAVDEVVAAPVGWSPQEVDCPWRHV